MERRFLLLAFPQVHIKGLVPGFWANEWKCSRKWRRWCVPPKVALVEMGKRCSLETLDTIGFSGFNN